MKIALCFGFSAVLLYLKNTAVVGEKCYVSILAVCCATFLKHLLYRLCTWLKRKTCFPDNIIQLLTVLSSW